MGTGPFSEIPESGPVPIEKLRTVPECSQRWEMALTREDFLRLLPVAVGNGPYRVEGNDIAATGGAVAWHIRIEERPRRAFGPVGLPVLAVQLTLDSASDREARAFVDRFLLGFQRAGG